MTNIWREFVALDEKDLIRVSRRMVTSAEKRPHEIDYEAIRTAKLLLDEALANEPR